MLNPKLSATRSIPSRSSFRGNKVAIKEYPGRNSTKGRPRIILSGEISLRGGMRTKGMHIIVKKITSARSFGKCLISILFFGMRAFILSLGKGKRQTAKGKRFSTVPISILNLRAFQT